MCAVLPPAGHSAAFCRVELAAHKLAQPPIIWGGPDGLKEAAKESARYDKRRRTLTGQDAA